MQTFLPYPDFFSAIVLDYRRLGKQRSEAKQIIRALRCETEGWKNHSATRMWRGHELALVKYGLIVSQAWKMKGYRDNVCIDWFISQYNELVSLGAELVLPSWFGDKDFHIAHQSNLIRKYPEYYSEIFPNVPDNLPYIWPV
jgi:hypothetical protein